MREIAAVTVSRSDWGLYLPLLKAVRAHPKLHLRLLVSGMHLSRTFGQTVKEIETHGFDVFERVDSLVDSDSPQAIAESIGRGILGFSRVFSHYQPDILVVLGDRFDMVPAAWAALPFNIPIAHIHGGEGTEGLIDEAIRHSLTKLSHLHFASTQYYARRIIQMGEEPWRVTVSGALGLDTIRQTRLDSREETLSRFGFVPDVPLALVVLHPETLDHRNVGEPISNLLSVLGALDIQCLFTYPNADTAGREIIRQIDQFCAQRKGCKAVVNVGTQGYLSLLQAASVMVGNSSSGIIEAASFRLPVVNIGRRQQGRVHAENVLDCDHAPDSIMSAIKQALAPEFRRGLDNLVNPHGDGHAAERIVDRLVSVPLGKSLIVKRFHAVENPTVVTQA